MEFSDLKERMKERKAPESGILGDDYPNQDNDSLMNQIKKSNQRQIKVIKGLLYIMPIAAVVMVLLLLVNPDPDLTFSHRLTGGFIVCAFILYMPFAYKWYMLLKATEMGLPMRKFLEISEMRHRFWHKDSWMIIPYAFLLAGALNSTIMGRYWPNEWSTILGFVLVNVIFILFVGYAYWHNYRVWKRDKRPLHSEILRFQKEMETD